MKRVRENPLFFVRNMPPPCGIGLLLRAGRKPRCPAFVPGRVLHFRPGRGFALRRMWKSCRMPGLLLLRKRGASVLRMRGRGIRGRGCRRCCFGCVPVRCGSAVSCPCGLRIPFRPSPAMPRRPSPAGRTRGRRPGWCASGLSGCGGNNSGSGRSRRSSRRGRFLRWALSRSCGRRYSVPCRLPSGRR